MALALCEPLYRAGLGWLYFAILGIVATSLGIAGGILTAYSVLYQAKDNELLLSMPIPVSSILAVRVIMIYLTNFCFVAIVMIPASIVYWLVAELSVWVVAGNILMLGMLPLVGAAFSCLLGWVVAFIVSKIKYKTLITIVLSVGFLGGYYFLFSQAFLHFQSMMENAEKLGEMVKTYLYPFYQMGLTAQGNILSMLIFAAIVIMVFFVVYLVLAKSFTRIITTKKGTAGIQYKEKTMKESTVAGALLRREFQRFGSSATYMMNCGLGTLALLIAMVFAMVRGEWLNAVISSFVPGAQEQLPLLICIAVAGISALNTITAPSVSLEGNTLWLIRSLPVSSWQILEAKLLLHMLVTGIPVFGCSITCVLVCGVVKESILSGVLVTVSNVLFVWVCAALGLYINIKMPNFDWTNESVPVKQGLSVMLTLFIPWILLGILMAVYFLIGTYFSVESCLIFVTILFGLLSYMLLRILKTKGVRMFEAL